MFTKGFKVAFALYFSTIALATPDLHAVRDYGRGSGYDTASGMSC